MLTLLAFAIMVYAAWQTEDHRRRFHAATNAYDLIYHHRCWRRWWRVFGPSAIIFCLLWL